MEAFEAFVALALEEEGFVVSEAVKFPVRRKTRRQDRDEWQTHGYEVDLVGARADRLVLATVKSFLGSRGVVAEQVMGESEDHRRNGRYRLLNDKQIRSGVMKVAGDRYGFERSQIELRLYVGRFAGRAGGENERIIRQWAKRKRVGAGVRVYGLRDVVERVRLAAQRGTYRDNPALVAVKVLEEAGELIPLDR